VITRTSGLGLGGAQQQGGKTVTRTVKTGGGGGGDVSFNEGQYAMVTATGVNQVKDQRDQERKDMQDLNDRFANYIERVNFSQSITNISIAPLIIGQLSLPALWDW